MELAYSLFGSPQPDNLQCGFLSCRSGRAVVVGNWIWEWIELSVYMRVRKQLFACAR